MEEEVKEDREREAMVHQVLDMQHIHQLDSDRRRLCIENIPGGMYNMSCSQLLALANTAGSSSSVVAGSSFPSYGPDSQISMDSWVNSWKMESNPWSLTPESYIGTNTSITRDTTMELPQYEVPNSQKFICDLNLTPEETVTATKPRPTQPEFSPIALDTPGKRLPETEQKHREPIDKPFRETRTPAGGEKKRKRASATVSAGEKAAQLNTPPQVSRKRKKVRAKVVREGDTKPKRTVSKPAVKKKASAKTPAAKTSEENSYVQRPKRSTRRSLKFDNGSDEEEDGFCGLTFTSEGCIGISVGGKIIPDATMGVFGNIPKRRRTNGRNNVSSTLSLVDMVPATFMEPNGNFPGDDTHISQNHLKTLTRKRSSRVRRARKIGSMKRILKGLVGTIKGPIKRGRRGYKTPLKPPELKAIVSEMQSDVSRKKRSNRDPIESLLNAKVLQLQWSQQHSTGASTLETWEQKAICRLFEDLNINRESPCLPQNTETAITLHQEACQELNAMVQYVTDLKNYQPKVELDDETSRVWNLLVVSIDSEGIDGLDEDKQKWWEDERKMFHERANLFIARMRLVQGDRRFSPWKGSVVDSVVGVFLTQNVADHSSSSAFMDLAAEFPVISNSIEGSCYYEELESSVTDETVVNLDSGNAVETPRKRSPTCIVIDEIDDGDDTDAVCSLETFKTSVLLDSLTNSDQGMSTVSSTSTCWELNLNEAPLEVENCDAFRNSIDEGSLVQPTSNYQQELEKSILKAQDQEENTSTDMKDKKKMKKSPKKKTKKSPKVKSAKKKPSTTKPKDSFDWDSLRKQVEAGGQKRERTERTIDTVDWDALRCTNVHEIAEIIKKRGMYNMLASRIKAFLNRLVRDHEEIDLEWLRDVPPDKAKEFLLSINGLGLKSVECVRLLSLHQLAFPVDTNVGRIAVRLGWVPLQPLPDEVQMHLLELYPVLANVQKYLWPRLCKLDQKTLYELHYHMITFGKVFCTKQKPNCKACPMKAECRHYASACASARLALQDAEETNTVTIHDRRYKSKHVDVEVNFQQSSFFLTQEKEQEAKTIQNCEPIIEEPATPEPEYEEQKIEDIEDYPSENNYEISTSFERGGTSENPWENKDVIPTIMLNKEADISNELVVLSTQASSIPRRKLKTNERLRTEHLVYELPDFHPILEGFERRDRDDEFPYLLAIWTPGETANSSLPPRRRCVFYERNALCHRKRCFPCNNFREEKSQAVRGTILIPCRTAMRGSFPLNGTYFQTNEVFADHETSVDPINVPRECIWNLRRRIAYFGSSVSAGFAGLPVEAIQYGFWRGYVCVRGFDRRTRKPEILTKRLHCPPSKKNQEEDF